MQSVASRDIRLPLQWLWGAGPVGGFTGAFDTSRLHTSGDITFGFAGALLAGGILDLSRDRLLGDTFRRLFPPPLVRFTECAWSARAEAGMSGRYGP